MREILKVIHVGHSGFLQSLGLVEENLWLLWGGDGDSGGEVLQHDNLKLLLSEVFLFFKKQWFEILNFGIVHFIDVQQSYLIQQAAELRAYLKSKGAEISEENSEGGLHVDLAQIIEACDVCLKEDDKGLFLIFV